MKLPQFFITLFLSAVCLLLAIISSWQGRAQLNQQLDFQDKDRKINADLQSKQAGINRDAPQMQQVYQVYNAILKDIAGAAYELNGTVKDAKLKDLLAKNNITVNLPPPGSQPTPAATAPTPR